MRTKAWVALFLMFLCGGATSTAACSSSNNQGTGTANTSSDFIDQYCSYIGTCCGAEGLPSNGSQCRTIFIFETGTYNAQQGNACIAAVQAAANKDPNWCTSGNSNNTTAACNSAFSKSGGSVQPGGSCQSDSDCATPPQGEDVACRTSFYNGGSTSICQLETHGKAGDGPCLGTEVDTANGTSTSYNNVGGDAGAPSQAIICFSADNVFCDSTSQKCTTYAQAGESCATAECASGTYCDFTTEQCTAVGATGAHCPNTGTNVCINGDYCDTSTSTCAVLLTSGAACTSSEQCASFNCTGGTCGAGTGNLGLSLLCGSNADGG